MAEQTALQGEVLISNESTADAKAQALKENETIIKRNWAKATEKVEAVYRALTYIHTFDLWKQHKDDAGKRKYSSFEKYLFGEFGWELSRVRALQIIKATRQQMIDAGELPASAAEPRTRTAPEVTSERAAKVTAAQLQKVLDAFADRVNNIDEGDPDRAVVVKIFDDLRPELGAAIDRLLEVVEAAQADTSEQTTVENAETEKVAVTA
jgi:hypothetical protein